jgi:hypothetical protein
MQNLYDLISSLYSAALMPEAGVFYIFPVSREIPPSDIQNISNSLRTLSFKMPGAFLGARYASDK